MTGSADVIAIDAHVHLHDEADAQRTLELALETFRRAAGRVDVAVCMLAERTGFNVFESLRTKLVGTAEAESIWLDGSRRLLVLAGRQIVSAEGLEILGLAALVPDRLEGRPAREIIADLLEIGALPVLPWGAGKWIGRRGRLVDRLIGETTGIFLGDNGGRPIFWPVRRFARGVRVVAGSDPLPVAGAWTAIGSFGSLLHGALPIDTPAAALRRCLRDPEIRLVRYGRLATPLRFAFDQARLRSGGRGSPG
ncbi:hypothetical protein [Sphingosinicella sp. CPCC 101087]|uniref:hypothetical protein n=1 Tax=Sphingosinicella sp. CPCC 101087 TaxID=2497754 RepID=UPI001FB13B1C|nr:hypothetical protein [Sphingosinicella sp. CPCC 101087]